MKPSLLARFIKQLRSTIVTGLFIIIPIAGSLFIITKLFTWFDRLLPSMVGTTWPLGLGILITLIIAYFIGLIATHWMGRNIIATGEVIFTNIPFLSKIYLVLKEIMDVLKGDKKKVFQQPVMVHFPHNESYAIGFVTSESNVEMSTKAGRKLLGVFVPTAPNPTSGFLMYYAEEEVIFLDMTAEKAIKLIVSVGLIGPDGVGPAGGSRKIGWPDLFGRRIRSIISGKPVDPRD